MEKQLVQVALHLGQSQVKVTVRERSVPGLSFGPGRGRTVHGQGEGAHPSLQAGHVGLDLAEELGERAPQLIIQKSKVTADAGQSLDRGAADLYLWSDRQLMQRRKEHVIFISV